MQSKSTRGIQQSEVWSAADAIITAGERPTIERVRLKIGRGSPNTVSPMLESWFATLAPRLGVVPTGSQSAKVGAPLELRQALDGVWVQAVSAARDEAEAALAPERERLATRAEDLESVRKELELRDAALSERGLALEHALELAKSQLRDQAGQWEKAARDLEHARDSLATLVQGRDADRRHFDEQLSALSKERERIEQRASANERRLLEDVDRARQEAKQASLAIDELTRKHRGEKLAFKRANDELVDRLQEGQIEIAMLTERLQGAAELAQRLELAANIPEARRATKSRFAKPSTSRLRRNEKTTGSKVR